MSSIKDHQVRYELVKNQFGSGFFIFDNKNSLFLKSALGNSITIASEQLGKKIIAELLNEFKIDKPLWSTITLFSDSHNYIRNFNEWLIKKCSNNDEMRFSDPIHDIEFALPCSYIFEKDQGVDRLGIIQNSLLASFHEDNKDDSSNKLEFYLLFFQFQRISNFKIALSNDLIFLFNYFNHKFTDQKILYLFKKWFKDHSLKRFPKVEFQKIEPDEIYLKIIEDSRSNMEKKLEGFGDPLENQSKFNKFQEIYTEGIERIEGMAVLNTFSELRNNLIANANIDYSDLSSAINKEIENEKNSNADSSNREFFPKNENIESDEFNIFCENIYNMWCSLSFLEKWITLHLVLDHNASMLAAIFFTSGNLEPEEFDMVSSNIFGYEVSPIGSNLYNFIIGNQDLNQEMLSRGETENQEFKSTWRYDENLNKVNKTQLINAKLKAIAAFLNTKGGGFLFIGVSDSGEAIGLDLGREQFKNLDELDRTINYSIYEAFKGSENYDTNLIEIEDISLNGKKIIKISVHPSENLIGVILKGETEERFFERMGRSTKEITPKELIQKIKKKFKP